MLIFINKKTAIPYFSVKCITYNEDKGTTSFMVDKNRWVSTKGDWRDKIVKALQVKAIAVYRDHHVLRA
jgi:hypothetical protein